MLAGALMLLAVITLAALVLIPHGSAGSSSRYADYLNPNQSQNNHQCSLPVDQRTGGWTCYQP
jgi:hypothetical protein